MVSLETAQMPSSRQVEPGSSPRISFSADFLDESDFISISPGRAVKEEEAGLGGEKPGKNPDHSFEFLSAHAGGHARMLTADELFFEGKLLPFRAMQQAEKLSRINLKPGEEEEGVGEGGGEPVGGTSKDPPALAPPMGVSWSFIDDDPSPRPPKCTVLWKELLRLKKHQSQRRSFSSSLSPSSSSSSTSSSSSSMADAAAMDENKKKKNTAKKTDNNHDNDVKSHLKKIKKGLERTRTTSLRIRPMVNVPICTPVSRGGGAAAALPPLFPSGKGRV